MDSTLAPSAQRTLIVNFHGQRIQFSPPLVLDKEERNLRWLKRRCLQETKRTGSFLEAATDAEEDLQLAFTLNGKQLQDTTLVEALFDTSIVEPVEVEVAVDVEAKVKSGDVELELVPLRNAQVGHPVAVEVEVDMHHSAERKHDPSGHLYTSYLMQVRLNGMKWQISRRYSDFSMLNRALKCKFAATAKAGKIPWPSLPPKERIKRHSNSDRVIKVRLKKLCKYIQAVTSLLFIMQDPPVELLEFLGIARQETEREETVHIHALEPESVLKYGDVILFKCSHGGAKLQRNLTRSAWDHVGIVVPMDRRFRRNCPRPELGILEATTEGIASYTLFPRISSMQDYAVMAVRHLQVERTDEFMTKLRAFVKCGKQKRYSLRGVLARVLPMYNPKEDVFCSQLVAQALIALDCMNSRKKSALFWPVSFTPGAAVDKALKKHGVATLSPLRIIDFKVSEVYECSKT